MKGLWSLKHFITACSRGAIHIWDGTRWPTQGEAERTYIPGDVAIQT